MTFWARELFYSRNRVTTTKGTHPGVKTGCGYPQKDDIVFYDLGLEQQHGRTRVWTPSSVFFYLDNIWDNKGRGDKKDKALKFWKYMMMMRKKWV